MVIIEYRRPKKDYRSKSFRVDCRRTNENYNSLGRR